MSRLSETITALGPVYLHPYVKSVMAPNGYYIELPFNLSESESLTARFYIEFFDSGTDTEQDPFPE